MRFFSVLIFCSCSCCLLAQVNSQNIGQILGAYHADGLNAMMTLYLKGNGTFRKEIPLCPCIGNEECSIKVMTGEFAIQNDKVILFPKQIIDSLNDNFKWKIIEEPFDTFMHIYRKEFSLVHHHEKLYLLSKENIGILGTPKINDILSFQKNVQHQQSLENYWSKKYTTSDSIHFKSIENDYNIENVALDTITAHLISQKRIKRKIQFKPKSYHSYIVEIDKGASDGVEKGMIFCTDAVFQSRYYGIKITLVNKNTSIGYLYTRFGIEDELPIPIKGYKTHLKSSQ